MSSPTHRLSAASAAYCRWIPLSARSCGVLLLLGLFGLGGQAARATDMEVSREYQLKAAFLLNFTKYAEWPPQRFESTDTPIVIGVLGTSPFGDELEKVLRDRKVNGRAVVFKPVADPGDAMAVHLLFVPAGEEKRLAGALGTIGAAGVLTVGESDLFATLGGMITFVTEAEKVRFAINQAALVPAGLKLSSQLLKLAVPAPHKP